MKEKGLKVSFYLKKSEMTDGGLCPVMGRINVGRYSEAAFSAKLTASPKAWILGRATGKSMASQQINRRLDEIRAAALSVYQELSAVHMRVSAEDVKCHIQGMAFGQDTLMVYFSGFIENFGKRVGVNRASKTLATYRYTYKCLTDFLKTEYRLSDISFTALDRSFIDKYDIYLRTKCKLAVSTVKFHTTRLKMIVSEAITDGVITANPFAGYEAETPQRKQKHLTSEELERLMTTPLHESRL